MPAPKQLTREKVEERIPFCYGILQRIADDLEVSRTAVSKFLNQPENSDLKELVKSEKKRIREYAEMTVAKYLISGDIETAKWFLTAFPSNGLVKKPKPYKPKKNKEGYILLNEYSPQEHIRMYSFPVLDYADGKLPNAVTKYLPYEAKEQLGLIKSETEDASEQELEKEIERNHKLREKNKGKTGHEIYEEFKRSRG